MIWYDTSNDVKASLSNAIKLRNGRRHLDRIEVGMNPSTCDRPSSSTVEDVIPTKWETTQCYSVIAPARRLKSNHEHMCRLWQIRGQGQTTEQDIGAASV